MIIGINNNLKLFKCFIIKNKKNNNKNKMKKIMKIL